MRLTPASRAAWIARIDWPSSGRPESDIGIAPRPIGNTSVSARRRVSVWVVVMAIASPPPGWHKPSGGELLEVDRFHPTADPYRDTNVIGARGPRTNQAVIGGPANGHGG